MSCSFIGLAPAEAVRCGALPIRKSRLACRCSSATCSLSACACGFSSKDRKMPSMAQVAGRSLVHAPHAPVARLSRPFPKSRPRDQGEIRIPIVIFPYCGNRTAIAGCIAPEKDIKPQLLTDKVSPRRLASLLVIRRGASLLELLHAQAGLSYQVISPIK